MSSAREEHVYMAKLAEQAERYEEMVEFMEKVVGSVDNEELSIEERNLLSVAYKNVIGARRASWRIISSIEQREESRGNDAHVSTIKEYRSKIEKELSSICDWILKLIDSRLVPSASGGDSKVFYLKMKEDYHRYLAEFNAERKEAAENTLTAYKDAQILAALPALASVMQDYQDIAGRVVDTRIQNAIRQFVSLVFQREPPEPIPPQPRRRRRESSIDPGRHNDAGFYR